MDNSLRGFLGRQFEEGMALAADSDLFRLVPFDGAHHQRYVAEFRCTGLVQAASGEIVPADHFGIGIWFPDDYLRFADPFTVLTMLGPPQTFHPNVSAHAPFICPGYLAAGTELVDILYRCFEILTWNRVTMVEKDALNVEACAWARRNLHRLPVDNRPLKRARTDFRVEAVGGMR